ncbi:MAG: hypothetical protein WC254_05570, partial [Candidatus Woesearchaeota archaeon]
MSWFDKILHSGYVAKASLKTAAQDVKQHGSDIVQDKSSWLAEQTNAHNQLKLQREQISQQIGNLKDESQHAGMSPSQRSAEVMRLAGERPGFLQTYHAHPIGRAVTALPRILGSALFSLGKKGVQIAPRVTPGSNTWLIVLALIYHFIILFSPSINLTARIILNLFMILIVILVVFDSSERNGDSYRTLFLWVFILEIFVPFAVSKFSILSNFDFIKLYIANGFIVLTWIYYAVFIRGRDITHGLTHWLRIFIILFWFGVAMSFIGTSLVDFTDVELDSSSTSAWFAASQVFSKTFEGWGLIWNTLVNSFSNIQTIFSMRMKQATGEYYFGVVEENEKEQLGVYLEDLKSSQTEYE